MLPLDRTEAEWGIASGWRRSNDPFLNHILDLEQGPPSSPRRKWHGIWAIRSQLQQIRIPLQAGQQLNVVLGVIQQSAKELEDMAEEGAPHRELRAASRALTQAAIAARSRNIGQ